MHVTGATYAGETDTGLHFADEATGLGVRYGHATWVDARGERTEIGAAWEAGEIVLAVPAGVVQRTAWPAVLDPVIGAEFGVDGAIVVPAYSASAPTVAFGGGKYLVVWSDWRPFVPGHIFGARVTGAGVVLDVTGIDITPIGNETNSSPAVAYDGTNFFVVWSWSYGPSAGVRGVRLSSNGAVLGSATSVLGGASGLPAVTFDGAKYLVATIYGVAGPIWYLGLSQVDLSGTVVNSASVLLGSANFAGKASVSFDGTNFLAVFTRTVGLSDSGVYGRRISKTLADLGEIVISPAPGYKVGAVGAFDGTNYCVVWADPRGGATTGTDIYGARVSTSGAILDSGGIAISTAVNTQSVPAIGFDGANYMVTWMDQRIDTQGDVYAARVSPAGGVLDAAGVPIAPDANPQGNPALAFDGSSFLVAWQSSPTSGPRIYAARVTTAVSVIDSAGILVSTDVADKQENPAIASDGINYFVVWQDCRADYSCLSFDIYGVRVSAAGTILDSAGVPIATTSAAETSAAVAFDGTDYLVVWEVNSDIAGARISPSGVLIDTTPIVVTNAADNQYAPALACDASNCLIVWQSGSSDIDIYGARLSRSGAVLDSSGFPISTGNASQLGPAIAFDGTNYFVAWEDQNGTGPPAGHLYGTRVTTAGGVLDPGGIAISAVAGEKAPALAFDGTNYLAVWQDSRGATIDIYGSRVSAAGVVLDAPAFAISLVPGDQTAPSVVYTGDSANYLVAWQDLRNGSQSDVYGSWVTMTGTTRDPGGIAISTDTWNEAAPVLAAQGSGRMLIAYQGADPALGPNAPRVMARLITSGALEGANCATNSDCASRSCSDGVCCDTTCGGACQTCAATPGTCTPVTSADDPDTCTGGSTCNATGACKLRLGRACASAGVCGSGFCADGYCCDSACTGGCDVCSATQGTCSAIGVGSAGSPSCAPYLCNGAASCPANCFADSDCVGTHYCAADSTCKLRRNQGAVCNAGAGADCIVAGCRVCNTAACVDGFCCDAACSGKCDVCSSALGASADGTCGAVAAGSPGSPSCSPYLCSGSSSACATSCASDAGCAAAAFCQVSGGTCQPDQPNGGACSAASQCASGYCIDGVCCDNACDGLCKACSKASKGHGNDGICDFVSDGTDPRSDCPADSATTCQHDGLCNQFGACRYFQAGTSCGAGSCSGNTARGLLCNGSGACLQDSNGIPCAPFACQAGGCLSSCTTSADCFTPNVCFNGVCGVGAPNGTACTSGGECTSKLCADGVCCDKQCGGLCEACTAAKKGIGNDGECGPVQSGSDPDAECQADNPPCGHGGSCDGQRACGFGASGVACGVVTCSGNAPTGQLCDGLGACLSNATGSDCKPYQCAGGRCNTSCGVDADCVSWAYCAQGVCKDKSATGVACTTPSECLSGFCVDHVCCDTECTGQCQACAQPNALGVCSAVTGPPIGPRPACKTDPGSTCSGTCDGANADTCTYPGTNTPCGTSCADGAQTVSSCNGDGACLAGPPEPCGAYLCEGTAQCKTSCTSSSDCAGGNVCRADDSCGPATSTCDGDHTVTNADKSILDCSPYRCGANGTCIKPCFVSADCVTGSACSQGACTSVGPAPAATAADEGGCGCRVSGDAGGRAPWLVLAPIAWLAARRRRQRIPSASADTVSANASRSRRRS